MMAPPRGFVHPLQYLNQLIISVKLINYNIWWLINLYIFYQLILEKLFSSCRFSYHRKLQLCCYFLSKVFSTRKCFYVLNEFMDPAIFQRELRCNENKGTFKYYITRFYPGQARHDQERITSLPSMLFSFIELSSFCGCVSHWSLLYVIHILRVVFIFKSIFFFVDVFSFGVVLDFEVVFMFEDISILEDLLTKVEKELERNNQGRVSKTDERFFLRLRQRDRD